MLRSYMRLIVFAIGLLVGVQWPGLLNEYTVRVQAHLTEARNALQGFSDTAAKFFNGDLQALVQHYQGSDDPVFRSDAQSISALVSREAALRAEWEALQGPWYQRSWHVLSAADGQIRDETLQGYNYQVPLAPQAIAWGVGIAVLLALAFEWLMIGIGYTFGIRRHTPVPESWR
ncbi:DUF2937 family protein [Pseudomonas typographi]|uniref:DUF2937 family protein n=1 Tax=Pseudomonas typographi TaxID=2715964 RepID=A0ABR7Z4I4_9PSED|nr:DUF2937 family protein [Pseudomonas typographi]MBD1553961.1 DUF2937 family protein [Pseudomonas typographi]MBD1588040.1 DUF2937 family protein [Pseudomonas typographi]MBD1600406.1 DUF2937 family protein [Pseudomonas typographi]